MIRTTMENKQSKPKTDYVVLADTKLKNKPGKDFIAVKLNPLTFNHVNGPVLITPEKIRSLVIVKDRGQNNRIRVMLEVDKLNQLPENKDGKE